MMILTTTHLDITLDHFLKFLFNFFSFIQFYSFYVSACDLVSTTVCLRVSRC